MNAIGRLIRYERIRQNMSQEALCEGICSNTYLSKIENGLTDPNRQIIELLVEALGYTYLEAKKTSFADLENTVWSHYYNLKIVDFDFSENNLKLINDLYMSDVADSVIILKALIDVYNGRTVSNLFYDVINSEFLNDDLRYKYYVVECIINSSNSLSNPLINNFHDDYGYILFYKASELFLKGNYNKSEKLSQEAYQKFSLLGNIPWMIQISFIEAASVSNMNHFDKFIKISNRIELLNDNVKNKSNDTDFLLNYNLGSTYLVLNEYKKSEKYLLKSLKCKTSTYNSAYEKLSLLFLFQHNYDKAREYIERMDDNFISKDLLKYMLVSENDLKSKEYIYHLENCYYAESDQHHGRSMLFGTLLFDAYKSTYQYPKALKLMEETTFLSKPKYFKK